MSAPRRVVVSAHARRRWRERAAQRLNLADIEAVARSAWQRGARTKRSLRNTKGVRRLYMGYTFVFDPDAEALTLITVIPPKHG